MEELCISSGFLELSGVSVCNADSDEGLVLEEGAELGPQVIVVKRSIVLVVVRLGMIVLMCLAAIVVVGRRNHDSRTKTLVASSL